MSDSIEIPVSEIAASAKSSLQAPTSQQNAFSLSASEHNFRDVTNGSGQAPYKNRAGQALRTGMFYRSSAFALPYLDQQSWRQLGISTVYDLRTPSEIKGQPDQVPEGVQYRHINVLEMDNVVFGSLSSANETVSFMQDLQRKMVTDANMRRGFATVLTELAQDSAAQIYHCSGGKDRTGWISVLLLSYAGLHDDDVMQDYLLSNQYLSQFVEQTYEAVAGRFGKPAADAIRPALTVQESFLQAGLEQLLESYGHVERYLRQGLALDTSLLEQLRHKLLA